jgi:hypothetical protein
MEMSMPQHTQHIKAERERRLEERKDRKAMQDMLAKVVSGAFASFKEHTKKNKDDDDDDEEWINLFSSQILIHHADSNSLRSSLMHEFTEASHSHALLHCMSQWSQVAVVVRSELLK